MPPPLTRRIVPAQCDQPGIVRQPVFRAGQRIRRDRRRASGLAGIPPMMAADSLHVSVHLIVLSGVSFRLLLSCRHACSGSASASHFALPPAQPSNVQASCLERGWPVVIAVFAGALATGAAAPPGRRCRERDPGVPGEANAEGKIEGCGTTVRTKPVCTWVGRGTPPRAASCRLQPPCLAGIGNTVCRIRLGAMGLYGAAS